MYRRSDDLFEVHMTAFKALSETLISLAESYKNEAIEVREEVRVAQESLIEAKEEVKEERDRLARTIVGLEARVAAAEKK